MTPNDSNTATAAETAAPTYTDVRPTAYVRDEETGTRLTVALPGVRKEDLKLTVHEGVLKLEAPRAGTSGQRYRFVARLSERLDGSRVTAALENGVLELQVALREEALPRSIEVS